MESSAKIVQYKCPSCNGIMEFDPKEGKLKCPWCGTMAAEEDLEKQETESGGTEPGSGTPVSDQMQHSAGWGENAQQMQGYKCSSCGAELVADAHTVATRCPYCGNNAVTADPFHETIRPDYVIPFAHTKEEVKQRYREYTQKKRFFLPAAFTNQSYIDEIQGVYVPFWLFSGRAEGEFLFTACDEETTKNGDARETTKTSYDIVRAGSMAFSKVPADASARMPDDLMDSLEPYDYAGMKPFDMSYLPGFLAESFDVGDAENEKRAEQRITNSFRLQMEQTVKHKQVRVKEERIHIGEKKTEYALLPVWLLSTKWNDKTFLFAMNGQNGRMTGDLPVNPAKKWGFIAVLLIALLLLLHLPLQNWIVDLILAAIITLIVSAIVLSSMKPVARRTQAGEYTEGKLLLTREEERITGKERTMKPVLSGNPSKKKQD